MLSIFGYGSLMNYKSVLKTMPNAVNHRYGSLPGYQRVFSLISVGRIKAGLANWETMEVAALAIRPAAPDSPDAVVRGCIFEIPQDELEALREREHRYKIEQLDIIDHSKPLQKHSGEPGMTRCYAVLEQSSEAYLATMTAEEYDARVGKIYPRTPTTGFAAVACGELWGRLDIKPLRAYLTMCLQAAIAVDEQSAEQGCEHDQHMDMHMDMHMPTSFAANFLDQGHLADGTSVREYMCMFSERFPEELMRTVRRETRGPPTGRGIGGGR